MAKYIDANILRKEIERRKKLLENGTGHPEVMKRVEGVIKAYNSILSFIDSFQQDKETLELCSKIWWEEQGWIMIPPDATVEGIDSLLRQVKKKLQQNEKPGEHWQPCDEHFRALKYAIEYFKKKKNDTTHLEDLYNGLKKLS